MESSGRSRVGSGRLSGRPAGAAPRGTRRKRPGLGRTAGRGCSAACHGGSGVGSAREPGELRAAAQRRMGRSTCPCRLGHPQDGGTRRAAGAVMERASGSACGCGQATRGGRTPALERAAGPGLVRRACRLCGGA